MTICIKDWEKFQHFKDRNPPWVKLYKDLLDDPEWHELNSDSAKVLVMLWLVASEDENKKGELPALKKLAFRLRISESELNQHITKLSHWLIHGDIRAISDGYQVDAPETETETETETHGVLETFIEHRKKIKKPMTDLAVDRFKSKLESLASQGFEIKSLVDEAIINGWQTVYPPKMESASSQWDDAI